MSSLDSMPLISGVAAVWLAVMGLSIGSFLNVVIARVPAGISIVHPRSRCPTCGHMLPWYENIPVVSWLLLRGRCSGCQSRISFRYPAVELLTGFLFVACLRRFGWSYELIPALVLVTLLIPLTFIDLEHWILPYSLTVPGIVAGVLLNIPLGATAARDSVIGAAAGFVIFRLLEVLGALIFKKEALGGGDKMLLALLGAFLSWKALLGIIFFSMFQGALVGVAMLLRYGRAGPAVEPPSASEPTVEAEGARESDDERSSSLVVKGDVPHEQTVPDVGGPRHPEAAPTSPLAESVPPASASSVVESQTQRPGLGERILRVMGLAASEEELAEEDEVWQPGPTSLPLGPWLCLAAMEILLLGPWLAEHLPGNLGTVLTGISP